MSDTWTDLTAKHGRRCVMSPTIDDATLNAETERQISEIFPLIKPLLNGREVIALDYGCGAGRFTAALADCIDGWATGYDPCGDLIALAQEAKWVDYVTMPVDDFFRYDDTPYNVVFAAMVIGHPGIDTDGLVGDLVNVIVPDGLMIVLDHMPFHIPQGRWWKFRPERFYIDLFERHGVKLERIGKVMQLENEVTVLAGRRQ